MAGRQRAREGGKGSRSNSEGVYVAGRAPRAKYEGDDGPYIHRARLEDPPPYLPSWWWLLGRLDWGGP